MLIFFPREAHGTFAENQKCHAIRKAYQVVLIPKYTWSSPWITLILIFTHCVASSCNSHDKYWTAVERIQQLWTGIQVASSLTQLKWYSFMVGLVLWSVKDSSHLFAWHSQAMNKTTAKKHVESVSRQYVNAKRSTAEYENITRGLIRGGTSTPLQGTPQETQQVWGEREREIENRRRDLSLQLHSWL